METRCKCKAEFLLFSDGMHSAANATQQLRRNLAAAKDK